MQYFLSIDTLKDYSLWRGALKISLADLEIQVETLQLFCGPYNENSNRFLRKQKKQSWHDSIHQPIDQSFECGMHILLTNGTERLVSHNPQD